MALFFFLFLIQYIGAIFLMRINSIKIKKKKKKKIKLKKFKIKKK